MSTQSPPLTPHQQDALAAVQAESSASGRALLVGFAGSGKTTVIAHVVATCPATLVLAPTNRACQVLRDKLPGAPVQTVHSACLGLRGETHETAIDWWRSVLRRGCPDLDYAGSAEGYGAQYRAICSEAQDDPARRRALTLRALRQAERNNQLEFGRNEGQAMVEDPQLVLVDEASMLSTEDDFHIRQRFPDTPVVYVGDGHQLPPVVSSAEQAQGIQPLLATLEPTAELTEPMRQQEDSRLYRFVDWLRATPRPRLSKYAGLVDSEDLTILPRPRSGVTMGLVDACLEILGEGFGQGAVLCRRNDTRRQLNRKMRQRAGMEGDEDWMPVPGDRLVVSSAPSLSAVASGRVECPATGRKPTRAVTAALTKGVLVRVQACAVVQDAQGYDWLELEAGLGEPIVVPAGLFLRTYNQDEGDVWAFRQRGWYELDYGYCLTVHKAQGSEFDQVLLYEQHAPYTDCGDFYKPPDPREHKRFVYTACTRARKRLVVYAAPLGSRKGG